MSDQTRRKDAGLPGNGGRFAGQTRSDADDVVLVVDGPTGKVDLTDDELALLDGRCRPETQAKVDEAKIRLAARSAHSGLTAAQSAVVADALMTAERDGELRWRRRQLRYCSVCKGRPDPPFVLLKSGPNRGRPNTKKPRFLRGIEMSPAFVFVEGHIRLGACESCMEVLGPQLKADLVGKKVQLPPELRTEGEPLYRKFPRRGCPSCGWEGHEGEMKRERTLDGQGTFAARCPSCSEQLTGIFINSTPSSRDGFEVVEVNT
jgi:hypothetical protein